jgi:transcriptional regulator with XRE-family HTH domain
MAKSRNVADWLKVELDKDPEFAEQVSKSVLSAEIAQQIYNLRSQAGLSQTQLAEKSGTTQSVISRIEDDDYNSHSLKLLHKIAWALGLRLSVIISKEPVLALMKVLIPQSGEHLMSTPAQPTPSATLFIPPMNRSAGYWRAANSTGSNKSEAEV